MRKLALLLLIATFSVSAAPVRFDFVFADPNSIARTAGYIVFEEDLLANPGDNVFNLPHPAVLDLQLTVTGSVNSDGNYDINDYEAVDLWTNGGTLDFSQPLVGQPTDNAPWGTTQDGESGEFNLFAAGGGMAENSTNRYESKQGIAVLGAPTGCYWFTICEQTGGAQENGLVSPMRLQSMQQHGVSATHAIPSLSLWSTLALGLAFLFIAGLFRRRLS